MACEAYLVFSEHYIFCIYSEPKECSPHILELFLQDAFQSFHLWLCLPSSLFSFKRNMETTT